ncbi:hypothetical protein CGRA01v4_06145 [Colletotrichum graminicola]|nr:hypothetical protein CGRA01v4_06145 [Colletotrichum graminicola]
MYYCPTTFLLGVAFSSYATARPANFLDFGCTDKINNGIFQPLLDAQDQLGGLDSITSGAVTPILDQSVNLIQTRFQDKRLIGENPHQTDVDTLTANLAKIQQLAPGSVPNFAFSNSITAAQEGIAPMTKTCKIDSP